MAELVQYYGTGRRKSAIARVYLRPGSGDFKVNGRPFEQYFVTESQRSSAKQPLLSTETAASFNVLARVSGGGVNGQADAVKLGIARALMLFNIELRKKLKAEGMVSRDSRSKERKKYGQKGARKRFQYSNKIVSRRFWFRGFTSSKLETRRLETEVKLFNSSCASRCGAGMAIRGSSFKFPVSSSGFETRNTKLETDSPGCRPNEEVDWLTLP